MGRSRRSVNLVVGWRVAALLGLASALTGGPAVAADGGETFVVRSLGDGGDISLGDDVCDANPVLGSVRCTLRAAIEEANADVDEDRIEFRIGGSGSGELVVRVPEPGLPAVLHPLVIDGYSQPGSRPNTAAEGSNAVLRIVLCGPGIDSDVSGLATPEAEPTAIEVRGLVIGGFTDGIVVRGPYSIIAGNFIGTDAAGLVAVPNGWGVEVHRANHTRIGGFRPADRNVIGGNRTDGIYIGGGDGVRVMGNLIGVTANLRGALPSDHGSRSSRDPRPTRSSSAGTARPRRTSSPTRCPMASACATAATARTSACGCSATGSTPAAAWPSIWTGTG